MTAAIGLASMSRRDPRSPRANLGKAIGSPTGSLRAPTSDFHDPFGTCCGHSGFVLQAVVSLGRPLGPHAQQSRLSRSFSEPLLEGELASSSAGVGQNRLALVAAERVIQSRKQGCLPRAFRPFASRQL
jgi:hypothetical protein